MNHFIKRKRTVDWIQGDVDGLLVQSPQLINGI